MASQFAERLPKAEVRVQTSQTLGDCYVRFPTFPRLSPVLLPVSDLNWQSAAPRKATTFSLLPTNLRSREAAASLQSDGAQVQALLVDLATTEGVDKLYAAAKGRPVDALLANAGRGLGVGFLDQDFGKARRVIDTNVTGTVYLIHKVANDMRRRNAGRES